MSTTEPTFKYGPLTFRYKEHFDLAVVDFMIVPEGYLVRETNNVQNIYMFRTHKEMKDYFTDFSKLQID